MIGALGGMPHVIEGAEAVDDLRRPGGLARAVEDAGITDDYEREVHAVMLRRALQDLDKFAP